MKTILNKLTDGRRVDTLIEGDLISAIEARGYRYTGPHIGSHLSAKLQCQPEFEGLWGPMLEGESLRYKDWGAKDRLSSDDFSSIEAFLLFR